MVQVFLCIIALFPWKVLSEDTNLFRQVHRQDFSRLRQEPPLKQQSIIEQSTVKDGFASKITAPENRKSMFQALFTVGVAEIFDKTWFVVLMMALSADKWMAFWGGLTGLQLHVAIAAGLGFSISRVLALSTLNFMAAAAFAIMTMFYAWEWYTSEPDADVLAAGKEEAAEEIKLSGKGKDHLKLLEAFSKTMWLTFIAEWGDRTQIAMIGLHSSKPLVPVCFGSAIAFLLLTASACLTAKFIGTRQLSETLVKGISAVSFAVFTLLSINDGFLAAKAESAMTLATK